MPLFACWGCYSMPKEMIGLSIGIGGAIGLVLFLAPFLRSVPQDRAWGWPRPRLADAISLLMLLGFVWLLTLPSLRAYSRMYVYSLAALLAIVMIYVWLRSTWMMDVCGIDSPLRRILLPGYVMPSIVIGGSLLVERVIFFMQRDHLFDDSLIADLSITAGIFWGLPYLVLLYVQSEEGLARRQLQQVPLKDMLSEDLAEENASP